MANPFEQFAWPTSPPPAEPMYAAPQPPMNGYGAPPPQPYGASPYDAPQQYTAPPTQQPYGAPPQSYGAYGAPLPPQPSYGAPYGQAPTYEQQPPTYEQPPTAYGQQPPEPPAYDAGNPFGAPPAAAPPVAAAPLAPAPPVYDSSPPAVEPTNPFAQPPQHADAAGNPFGAPESQPPAPPVADPWGAAPQQPPASYQQPPNPYGAPPPQQPYGAPPQPYGAPSYAETPDNSMGALVPAQQQSNPYAVNPYGQQLPAYGAPAYGAPPQDPYGYPPQPYGQPAPPPPPPAVDPFSVFESQAIVPAAPPSAYPGAPPAPVVAAPAPASSSDDDFWGGFGGNAAPPSASEAPSVTETKTGEDGLPPGGEWYDAKIFTPTLGVMFFKPQELTDSLFLNTDKAIVDALGERPVVAFIVEGSSARAAGVELGHVLLKVNGVDVKNPKDASRLIKEGPRPLPLLFYVPNTDVVVAEGEHMVKYDTRDTIAPNSAKEWKPKYVVIGGIIAQPWMMNMYRSKSEYDIAVIETQARRPVSVKVKQFSLQGARIQNDWQGPQMVKYKNKLQPWKYIVVLPVARNPIKISSPNLSQLKPVHEGIRRVLLAQQRSRGDRDDHDRQQEPHRY
ncbi:hypothetical protein FisN_24Lh115 [Fistulifera solaris]|uniref:PDZ domain-containing protein n=1 Tax=Fistulifera solaris TaxID=1519565 RepID=A0A1Z5K9P4_FISSO|nr:hypothetical protein FisN_24Lh115 [Fistulifera solaris]|eukprot:GAX22831.1 hypothetical protein FisN_24Lh115 [Fistulifera solaris]